MLERIGTVTLHRDGVSALYGKYLRHIVRKAAAAVGTEALATPVGGAGLRTAAVSPLNNNHAASAFQPPLNHVNGVLAAAAAAADPMASSQPYGLEAAAAGPWTEQFQFSAMSDDQVMEALSRVGNEFDPGFGAAGFAWEDAATLDWMDWSNLPEYRM